MGKRTVLEPVDFRIEKRELVTIVSLNGSGKATFLKANIGAIPASESRIERLKSLRIGYVPEKLYIDRTLPMTVALFLCLPQPVLIAQMNTAQYDSNVPDLGGQQMTDLSGGQFQPVLLARALLNRPELLLLDEATQGLDQPGPVAFYSQIQRVRARLGCAVLMVSHELHVVMSASDWVVCLNGPVCCEGKLETDASAPEYYALFRFGTHCLLALYRHDHNHSHDHSDAPANCQHTQETTQ